MSRNEYGIKVERELVLDLLLVLRSWSESLHALNRPASTFRWHHLPSEWTLDLSSQGLDSFRGRQEDGPNVTETMSKMYRRVSDQGFSASTKHGCALSTAVGTTGHTWKCKT